MGGADRMSLKQQVVLFSLVFLIDVSFGELATCNPQNRECSCADTSSRDCDDFFPSERFHVDNIEECMDLCQALNPLGQCEWLLFHYSPAKEELSFIPPYLNCELFAPDDASLEQYVNTCDKQGQPTRRHDENITRQSAACSALLSDWSPMSLTSNFVSPCVQVE